MIQLYDKIKSVVKLSEAHSTEIMIVSSVAHRQYLVKKDRPESITSVQACGWYEFPAESYINGSAFAYIPA